MKQKSISPDNDYMIRCPRLGHQIYFSYCRIENKGLPCFKTLDCWFPHFLVEEYLRKELEPEEWEKAFTKPKTTKMVSLLELIEQAKKRTEKEA
ncbi:MAG: hypothetical protein H8D55_02080 [Deltaproteobacteria bacterium]|nr:hypothetical protein [Deltaproteobacteria bacterium]MBL7216429.1 hypothetical protein [Desulfobacteraceae bacterium]